MSENESKYLVLEKQLNELKTNSQSTVMKPSNVIESSPSDLDTLNKTVQVKLGN